MIHIGYREGRQAVYLDDYDLRTHVHGLGLPRTGKTKLIEQICRELIRQEESFCLIDPHGNLYYDLITWLSYTEPEQDIILFNPSYEERITGYNPFRKRDDDPAVLMTQANNMVAATLRAWGAKDSFEFPRMRKWLTAIFYTLIEQNLPISASDLFLTREHTIERERIISNIRSTKIRGLWRDIYGDDQNRRDAKSYLESVENRMEMFSHPTVRGILETGGLDMPEAVETGSVVLCKLQRSMKVSAEANKVLGTFIVNEIWEYFAALRGKKTFYLIIDECQRYLNPDIEEIVSESAKYGLHLFLFNQQGDQGGKDIEQMLTSARIKIRFDPSTDRVFTLERPGKEIETVESVTVETPPDYMRAEYEEKLMKRWPLKAQNREPQPVELNRPPEKSESPRTQIFNNAITEISDDDLFE